MTASVLGRDKQCLSSPSFLDSSPKAAPAPIPFNKEQKTNAEDHCGQIFLFAFTWEENILKGEIIRKNMERKWDMRMKKGKPEE